MLQYLEYPATTQPQIMAKGGADGKPAANDTKSGPAGYQFAIKPEERSGWEGFKIFLWNSETSEFLGRTASSWFKIGLFYIVYYLFLAGFFIAMLLIFKQTLSEDQPKWLGANGIIGDNPGLGYRPMPPNESVESTLVFFRHGGSGNWKGWVERLDTFLGPYKSIDERDNNNLVDCNFDELKPGQGQYCKVKANDLMKESCTHETNYGFETGTPCLLLKLNRIYGWEPQPYTNVSDFPSDAPKSLTDEAGALSKENPKMMGQMIWLNCEGENPADKENLGPVSYYPYPGFPTFHYPYEKQKDYLSPAVFAHLKEPKRGVLISIKCSAWAHNIKHDSKGESGAVHFELMID